MLKKINSFINILMGGFIGAFIGGSIFRYLDYKNHPELFAMQSAPWYTGIQISGIVFWIVFIVVAVISLIFSLPMMAWKLLYN
ncbi:hypothetical protein [Extibacter muris]|uniref:Uncharacterized protein n=1 Tax=Extibacter muris TaxID=1796622 RepID=A0A4R4FG49_9FIRM|nr:hypothetical protein [Extibacter muris]MCU0080195.1 hypothetical protein [Extibacter muris]TDA22575.1 hypothetical protein E1963_03910 [Extibacter muris]